MLFDTKLLHCSFTRVLETWSFLRPCLQVSRFPLKMYKDRPYYLVLNSGRSVSINVKKTRKHFPEIFMACACFPNVSQFTIQETLFPLSVFPRWKYAYATPQGILAKIRVCEQLQKFCEHEQASTDRVIVASNSSKRQILRALSNWMGPFNTPRK